jgi:hypothetical protein
MVGDLRAEDHPLPPAAQVRPAGLLSSARWPLHVNLRHRRRAVPEGSRSWPRRPRARPLRRSVVFLVVVVPLVLAELRGGPRSCSAISRPALHLLRLALQEGLHLRARVVAVLVAGAGSIQPLGTASRVPSTRRHPLHDLLGAPSRARSLGAPGPPARSCACSHARSGRVPWPPGRAAGSLGSSRAPPPARARLLASRASLLASRGPPHRVAAGAPGPFGTQSAPAGGRHGLVNTGRPGSGSPAGDRGGAALVRGLPRLAERTNPPAPTLPARPPAPSGRACGASRAGRSRPAGRDEGCRTTPGRRGPSTPAPPSTPRDRQNRSHRCTGECASYSSML